MSGAQGGAGGDPPPQGGEAGLEAPALPFEAALERLEQIVARLESSDLPLEEAMRLYEEGLNLAARCDGLLEEAELKVKRLTTQGERDEPS